MLHKPYRLLNLVFIILISLVVLYAVIFTPEKSDYPVSSAYTEITGQESISTGLSHSFSEIVRLNFSQAHEYNPYGIRIFLFFVVQLFFRINFLMIARNRTVDSSLITLDIVLSACTFLIAFWPFIVNTVKVISERL